MLNQRWVQVAPWIRDLTRLTQRKRLIHAVPNLAVWGAGFGVIALLIIEPTPLARRDILSKIPYFGAYWKNKLE